MNYKELQIKEVYALYGLAMYQAQCCERELGIILSSAFASQPDAMTRFDYDNLLSSNFQKTFRCLIKVLENKPEIDHKVLEDIKNALKIRNLLAHNYFWERSGEFTFELGREKMIVELNEYIAFLNKLDSTLSLLSSSWATKHGVTDLHRKESLDKIILNAINNLAENF